MKLFFQIIIFCLLLINPFFNGTIRALKICKSSQQKENKAVKVIEDYFHALGGKHVFNNLQTMKIVYDHKYIDSGLVQRVSHFFKRPDYYRYDAGNGLARIVMSGEKTWRKKRKSINDSWEKWRLIKHDKCYIEDWWGMFLNYNRMRNKFEYIGKTKSDGVELDHLRMYLPNGKQEELFFNAKSHLYYGNKTSKVLDYRKIGNLLIPFRKEGRRVLPNGKMLLFSSNIVDVKINIPLELSFFIPDNKKTN